MKISVMSASFRSLIREGAATLVEFIQFCGRLGVEGVELSQVDDEVTPQRAEVLAQALQAGGLAVSSYNVCLPFISPDKTTREEACGRFRELLLRAKSLGAPSVMLYPDPTGSSAPQEERIRLIEVARECAAYAGENGMLVTLENVGTPTGRQVMGTADHMLKIVKGVNSPHFRLVFDTGNFLYADEDPLEAIRKLIPHVAHVHLKDLARIGKEYRDVAVGQGLVNFGGILAALRTKGFRGYLSIECGGEGDRHAKKVMVETSATATRRIIFPRQKGKAPTEVPRC